MTNKLFTDLNSTESQDINGGGWFSTKNYNKSYSYDKSFNTYEFSGSFDNNNVGNEATLGDGSQIGLINL